MVIDLKATQVLLKKFEILEEKNYGKTGHSFVEENVREVGALLGGEVSDIFFGENYYGFDDAFQQQQKSSKSSRNQGNHW